jgi:hypothetical protein
MKKLIFSLVISSPLILLSQTTNTFPTTGPAGIGTLSPTNDLHILKTGAQANFLVQRSDGKWFKALAGSTGSGFIFKSDGRLTISPGTDPNTIFADNNNSLFFYGPDHPTYPGILTLGSDVPGDNSKFSVNGRIRSEELKIVNNVEAPDYVFKNNYNLKSLIEVEQFIKTHNHLPEIPSAAEFKANGIMVGQMSFDLLKKIEELTLYIIEMNKKVLILEAQLKEFQNKN